MGRDLAAKRAFCLKYNISMASSNVQETACGYAALLLQDQSLDITAEKLSAITKAAGIELQPVYAQTFEKVLKGRKLDDLLKSATSGGGGGGGAAAPAAAAATAPVAEVKEEVKEASSEDEGMDMDLFG